MHNQKKHLILSCLFIAIQISLYAQTKQLISGIITDIKTKEPLPFVTLSLKKQLIGVVSNEEGKFDLYIPMGQTNDTLLVNYLGYKHFLIPVSEIKEFLNIQLEETMVQLEEIVVRPLSPESYIRFAMRKINENYPKDPFQTTAYYRAKIMENKNFIKCNEGVFKTYYKGYLDDTTEIQNQLLLFRQIEELHKVEFMSRFWEKIESDTSRDEKPKLDISGLLGGPSQALEIANFSKKSKTFLDTTQFDSYKYSFAKSSSYNTDELIVIDFSTKKKINHVKRTGKLYIDLKSMAIVKIEYQGDYVLSALTKLVFFMVSIGIKNPTSDIKLEFQEENGKWYPKNVQVNLRMRLTNNHVLRKDELSDFEIEQFLIVNELKTENSMEVPLSKRFDIKKDMETQVFNDKGISWEELNIIKK